MLISAVIPIHDRRPVLARALDSVFAQTSPVDEVIVVDDGSSDGSAEFVAREYPRVRLIRQRNRGVSAARNRGIACAAGEWIALLDSDDSWQPRKVERMRTAITANPGYPLFHSDEIWVRNGKRVNPMHKHRKRGGRIFRHCLPRCAISPSAAVIRKSTLEALGGFDPELPACEDYDLWLRLCHRYPVYYLEEALVTKYGGHADQLSRRYPAMDRFRVHALARLLESGVLEAADSSAAEAVLLEKLEILIGGARKRDNRPLLDEFLPLQQRWLARQNEIAAC